MDFPASKAVLQLIPSASVWERMDEQVSESILYFDFANYGHVPARASSDVNAHLLVGEKRRHDKR